MCTFCHQPFLFKKCVLSTYYVPRQILTIHFSLLPSFLTHPQICLRKLNLTWLNFLSCRFYPRGLYVDLCRFYLFHGLVGRYQDTRY